MHPLAKQALDRARQPTPAPIFSTETVRANQPITLPAITGPINHYMRLQARAEAIATVIAMHRTLAATNGVALVVEHLKRTASGRPDSHVAGYLDIIEWLEVNAK
ncbi:hypothetical protein [Pseudomonas defluvii]|uniref:hypothetical protein n=1 Tax=Pseudomonas defluvii TaxID=1876757 RepID=UPI0008119429|nr:hypothetical protein [Pseudomonas defluvii]